MTIQTTGNSTVRFNPNLYNTGFLCLSILNTWPGAPEEQWIPNHSTLLQVFISIQSIIMTAAIANNEPGFEHLVETDVENQVYAAVVKYQNVLLAMVDVIEHPPRGFEEVVKTHFRLKREAVLKDVEQWVQEADTITSSLHCSGLTCAHNPATIGLFAQQGVKVCFTDALTRLRAAMQSLA